MKTEDTYLVRGVIVDPVNRKKYGAELQVEQGKIIKITNNPDISSPYILPGFIDAHVHIESSMMIPSRFAQMAVKQGTIAVVTDPHEVANVAGVPGVRFMVENSKAVPLKFFFGVPSCVPASPLEKSGAVLTSEDVDILLKEDDFYFLAEMMNFPGVIYDDKEVISKINSALNVQKPVDGHAPGLTGDGLKKYVSTGINTDHECSTVEEALEKIMLGMKILIREGSAAKNFESLIPLLKKHSSSIMFCTDDCHPDYLEKGHINKLVARAVAKGFDLFDTLKVACINPISHYGLPIGSIEVNQNADFVLVSDLKEFDILATYINGAKVFENGEVNFTQKNVNPPLYPFRKTHTQSNIKVICEAETINVIGAIEGELITHWLKEKSPVAIAEEVLASPSSDFLKIVLLDRYSEDKPVVAFIRGFGLQKGAIAASIAHDSHHIVAIGCDDLSIDSALEWIVGSRGGMCFAKHTTVEGIPLPYFGLMTNEEGVAISEKYKQLNNLVKENGCVLNSPFMTASFMALTVIPELKIFHNGLFDGINFKQVSLFH